MNLVTTPKKYFINLDATRFIGFLHVFSAHCFFTTNSNIESNCIFQFFQYNIRAGYLGLDYFFVLSSFLLTWIILEEKQHTGKFKAMFFLIRRALRLWPSYLLIVLGTYLIYFLLNGSSLIGSQLPPIEVFLLFHANYYIIFNGQDFLYLLVFLWVISVEEQFYVFWAFAMKYLFRYFFALIAVFVLASVIFRFYYFDQDLNLWFNTLSLLGNFGIGALAAYLAFNFSKFREKMEGIQRWKIIAVYLCFVPIIYYYYQWADSRLGITFEKLIFSFLFAFIILEQSFAKKPLVALGSVSWINYLGRISLGLYCYHGVVITIYRRFAEQMQWEQTNFQVLILNPFLILMLTIGMAILSYELLEKHIHRLRRKFYA